VTGLAAKNEKSSVARLKEKVTDEGCLRAEVTIIVKIG
jgi:hypothetical protein